MNVTTLERSKFFNTLIRERQVRFGFTVTLVVVLFALIGPLFAPYSATDLVGFTYGTSDQKALMGYDYIGHDVWSRLLHGGQSIIWMSLAASFIALMIGSALGLLAAFAKKKTDQFITWLTDIFMAFPDLILVLLIVSM